VNVNIASTAVAHDRDRLFLALGIAGANDYDESFVQQVILKGGRIEPLTMPSLITLSIAAPLRRRATPAMAARVPPHAISGTAAPMTRG
jgi:hypothetical protein